MCTADTLLTPKGTVLKLWQESLPSARKFLVNAPSERCPYSSSVQLFRRCFALFLCACDTLWQSMPNTMKAFEGAVFRRLRRGAPTGFVARAAFWLLPFTVVFFALSWLHGALGSLFTIVAFLAFIALAICSFVLLYRWLSSRLLWRVRNRLIVTYLLMGLAPLVLFATLSTIASYIFSGQFATYAATAQLADELERLSSENAAHATHIGHTVSLQPGARTTQPVPTEVSAGSEGLQNAELLAWNNGAPLLLRRYNGKPLSSQANSAEPPPSWLRDGFHGLVIENRRLYLRAFDVYQADGHRVTVLSSIPLTGAALDRYAQGLGQATIIPSFALQEDKPAAVHGVQRTRPASAGSSSEDGARMGQFATISGGVLPAPTFLLDVPVLFTAPLNMVDWQTGRPASALMDVTSRPSLLYQRLFGTSVQVGAIIREVLISIGILFAVLELIAFVMAVRLSRTITRSVAELYGATMEIDHGNFAHRIRVTRHDQLAALSRSFNRMSESLERLLVQQREKDRLQNELAIAQEVQNNLFPRSDLRLPSLELHGICKPARTVSGDYYDFLLVGPSDLCLAMGDISGKGISAALLMASLHSAVRAYRFAGEELGEADRAAGADASPFSSPGKMLGLLNRHLYRSTQPEKYATLFLAHYNSDMRKLTYSNGGQLPPFVLCANGSIKRLDCGGSVVGLLDGLAYEQAAVTLDRGDILIAYSDGVTEPENDFGDFGEERLLEIVARNRHLSLNAISSHVLQALRAWIGEAEQPDDITLVLARQA